MTVEELTEFVCQEENDTDGYRYLRGTVVYRRGRLPNEGDVRLALYLIRTYDHDLFGRLLTVSRSLPCPVSTVIEAIMLRLAKLYRDWEASGKHDAT